MLEVSHVCVQTSRKQGLCWGSWHFPERKGKQMMIDKSVINLALSITQGASVLRPEKLHNIKMIKVRLNCTSSLVFSFLVKQNLIISILFHYNSAILESGHCFKYNWFVKTTISVTWTYLKNTYLCQCSHSNGVDQLVEKEDHLFPVANKWAKLESSSCKIFCKERNTTLDMKTWVTNNSVINCKNETVLTRI